MWTYILVEAEEDLKVHVCSEGLVRGDPLQEHLVHGNSLLERGQVLPETHNNYVLQYNHENHTLIYS